MKKSEALSILGLSNGASDDEVKAAHRKKVIEHHPDKFPQGTKEHDQAEEKTKLINEARDVLLSRKWEPEYVRRGPYANPYGSSGGNPYANPYRGGASWPRGSGGGTGSYQPGESPFSGWPFDQADWVWTSWDGFTGQDGQPFDPFKAAREPEKTPEERFTEAKLSLRRDSLVLAVKIASVVGFSLAGSFPIGLFLYVAISLFYGIWKRFSGCLLPLLIPAIVGAALLLIIIAPRAYAMTFGLIALSLLAIIFDINNMNRSVKTYRSARDAVKGTK